MKHRRHIVTDHAIVQYLEQVRGISLDTIRAEINKRVDAGRDHGAASVVSNGLRFVLDGDGAVIDVMQARQPAHHIGSYIRRRERDE